MSLNDILFACVCLTAVYARSVSAAIFCALYALHSFYSAEMEQWVRYVVLIPIDSAVAFAVVSMEPLAQYILQAFAKPQTGKWSISRFLVKFPSLELFAEAIKRPSRASVITGVSSGVFLVTNVAGFIAWYLYFPPATYDAVCSVVYIALMAALINEGSNGRRRVAVYGLGMPAPSAAVRKSVGVHHQDGGQV